MSLLGVSDTTKYCPEIVVVSVVDEPVEVVNVSSNASTFVIVEKIEFVFFLTNLKSPVSTFFTLSLNETFTLNAPFCVSVIGSIVVVGSIVSTEICI